MTFFKRTYNLIILGMACGMICAQFILSYQDNPSILGVMTKTIQKSPIELIIPTWRATGDKTVSETSFPIPKGAMEGKNQLQIRISTHGQCMLEGTASSIALASSDEKKYLVLPLTDYGKKCTKQFQDIAIPLSDFGSNQDLKNVSQVHLTFWFASAYTVDVSNIAFSYSNILVKRNNTKRVKISHITNLRPSLALGLSTTPEQITPDVPTIIVNNITGTASASAEAITPTPFQPIHRTWPIESVSSMKETKDKICNQDSEELINHWLDEAKRLGVNYISLETPYDNPECGDAVSYTATWVRLIRAKGLNVWHRHMPVAFEGIYNTAKSNKTNYLSQIADYIKTHKDEFQENDIFTPIPEPQNGGISGINNCTHDICQFKNPAEFNKWIRDAMDVSDSAFASIGLKDKINVGFFGFDGFIAWGSGNSDWDGILEDSTIAKMGNITIDHYPEAINSTMEEGLNQLQTKYPNVPIVIGEWGTIGGSDLQKQVQKSMKSAIRPNVIGFNYWQLGIGGNEALINADFSEREHYKTVQSFFISN